ncbi:MAG TPA: diaminopimelate epimerase [Bacteroidales bacterium]|jgi:diaminopimelate epimerase|nr:diaminopimelate epimerase [Bacteroidales bacterium]HRS18838.1 diaminopimelate epimerase [Bacteroidales bacterium]
MQTNFFVKSHGLGNDYIVIDSEHIQFELKPQIITKICDVHYGIGSDGILVKVPSTIADFGLLIYNTDASVAENCGNGLRIFSKFLFDYGYVSNNSFTVDILGRLIHCEVIETKNNKATKIKVDMGKANFIASEVPVIFHKQECIHEKYTFGDTEFVINCVSVGNPHCVVFRDELIQEELLTYGPIIEKHTMFPNRINVQFAKVIDRHTVEIRIWERGVGNTLASGSSSCAVASVMKKNNLVDSPVTVKMPGGELLIAIDNEWNIQMTGPVQEIASGILSPELFE